MRPFAFLSLLLGLSLFGFGCKQPTYASDQPTNWRGVVQGTPTTKAAPRAVTAPAVDTRPYFDKSTPPPPELPILRQALQNLVSATSFRATLTLPPADGQDTPMKGELAFSRGDGFRGTISITPSMKSEVLVVGDDVFLRANTSTWQSIGKTPDGKKLRLFFQVAFPDRARSNQILVSDSAHILETKDDPSGCRAYTYTEVLPTGDLSKTVLCIKDALPSYIINEYSEGATEVRYRDINQPVDIQHALSSST